MPNPVIVTFVLVTGLILGAYWLFVAREEVAEQGALRRRLRGGGVKKVGDGPASAASLVRIDPPYSEIPAFDALLKRMGFVSSRAQLLIDRAGLTVTVGVLVASCLALAVGAFGLVLYFTEWPLIAAPFALFGGYIPVFVVRLLASRRMSKFEEQFPEAIDLLARALRAGHAFTTGLSLVAEEMPEPVGTEFKLAYDRQNFGMPLPDALRDLGRRVPLIDARFFVTAVLTQREVGGNLSEVLENLSQVVRERFRVKRQVRVITAHSRMTGYVLALMPPLLATVMIMLSPKSMSVLWTDPVGIKMVVGAVLLQILGSLIIKKLVNIEY
jgi:tight adherence protein B